MTDRLVGITGASGEVGRRLAHRLATRGARQRLIVRDTRRAPVIEGAEIRVASGYAALDEMRMALEGVDTLFLIPAREAQDRLAEHLAAVDAAADAGVQQIVYLSFLGASPTSVFTLARDHFATEQYIRQTTMVATFLRMGLYMDFIPSMAGSDGVIRGPAGHGRVSAILRDDIADVAAVVLTTDGHAGRTYDLTGGSAFTLGEAAALMSEVSGKQVGFVDETVEEAYRSRAVYNAPDWEVAGWVTSYQAIANGEFSAISDAVRSIAGHEPVRLAEYLRAHPESLDHVLRFDPPAARPHPPAHSYGSRDVQPGYESQGHSPRVEPWGRDPWGDAQ